MNGGVVGWCRYTTLVSSAIYQYAPSYALHSLRQGRYAGLGRKNVSLSGPSQQECCGAMKNNDDLAPTRHAPLPISTKMNYKDSFWGVDKPTFCFFSLYPSIRYPIRTMQGRAATRNAGCVTLTRKCSLATETEARRRLNRDRSVTGACPTWRRPSVASPSNCQHCPGTFQLFSGLNQIAVHSRRCCGPCTLVVTVRVTSRMVYVDESGQRVDDSVNSGDSDFLDLRVHLRPTPI